MGKTIIFKQSENNKRSRYCTINTSSNSKFEYISITFPDRMGSKFVIFKDEKSLSDVTLNSLLFQLNGTFMEECNDFEVVATIANDMVNSLKFSGVELQSKIFTEEGIFVEQVSHFLVNNVHDYIELIYKTYLKDNAPHIFH